MSPTASPPVPVSPSPSSVTTLTPEPSSSRTRRRKSKREVVIVPQGSESSTKLPKWLSKHRSNSLGSSESPNPAISISASSSTASDLAEGLSPTGGEAMIGLGLQSPRRRTGSVDEVLEEWATPDLEGGDVGVDPSRRNGQAEAKGKGGRFSLKKKTSHLNLFGRGSRLTDEEKSEGKDTVSPISSTPYGSVDNAGSSSLLDLRSSTSSFPTSSPLASASNGVANPNVAGRIGGWFSNMLSNSQSSPFDSPSLMSSTPPQQSFMTSPPSPSSARRSVRQTSPTKKAPATPTSSNRLGPLDRMLDKAVQYFLDTDSAKDQCEDDIWVMGVRHPGHVAVVDGGNGMGERYEGKHRKVKSLGSAKLKKSKDKTRASFDVPDRSSRQSSPSPTPLSVSPSTFVADPSLSPTSSRGTSPTISPQPSFLVANSLSTTTNGWPMLFYHDFYSRIALTYRTGFPPIPCSAPPTGVQSMFNSLNMSIGRGGGRTSEGLSSDTGWGCMLRTGQSLLANTLVTVHLGRGWRRPLPLSPMSSSTNLNSTFKSTPLPLPPTPSHAEYARILSLFIDDPSPLAPFSVHRFAVEGKRLGKEVGEWFGPSTAAGAIKTLVNDYEPAGLRVWSVADGTVYKSDVEAAGKEGGDGETWVRPVLVLIGLRLGIDGVNPVYHEGIKSIFQFPQSVGIAGGRPSSSYYFVGSQANSLFYIDPHHPRPSIALRAPPSDLVASAQTVPLSSVSPSSALPLDRSESSDTVLPSPPAEPLDVLGEFYAGAYSDESLRSYHCDKVRKMALSSLDPSMLVGFLIHDGDDWDDFSSRVAEGATHHKTIFALADAPPAWMHRAAVPSAAVRSPSVASFSEPDDWEIESTGASASPSPMMHPLDDDEWDETSRTQDDVGAPLHALEAAVIVAPLPLLSTSEHPTAPASIAGASPIVPLDDEWDATTSGPSPIPQVDEIVPSSPSQIPASPSQAISSSPADEELVVVPHPSNSPAAGPRERTISTSDTEGWTGVESSSSTSVVVGSPAEAAHVMTEKERGEKESLPLPPLPSEPSSDVEDTPDEPFETVEL